MAWLLKAGEKWAFPAGIRTLNIHGIPSKKIHLRFLNAAQESYQLVAMRYEHTPKSEEDYSSALDSSAILPYTSIEKKISYQ